jgi:acyl-CoA synthetase (AMP-forming)/AMP-acid ligase II
MTNSPLTIAQYVARSAIQFSDRPALHVPAAALPETANAPVEWTYAELWERSQRLAERLTECGLRAGERIAIALDNRPEFFPLFIAANSLGVSVVPLNAEQPSDDLGYILRHSDARMAVAHAHYAERLRAAVPELSVVTWDAAWPASVATAPRGAAPDSSTEAALLYTSGTTGKPKGCILRNEYFTGIAQLYSGLGGYCSFREGAERLITPLPVTHMNALAASFMVMVATGGCLIQLDRFRPTLWWQLVRESRATCLHYLGVMPAMLLQAPAATTDDLSGQIRFGFGAGCDPRHHATFEQRFGFPLIEAWAMTETGAGAWITANHEPRHVGQRCFGKVPAGLEIRIVDDHDSDVPVGAPGELLVRRHGAAPRQYFFAGYYKDAAATEAAWRDGWFRTGDAVRADADGSLYFVDRLKNIVRRSGENIAAVEVESCLMQAESVAACAVVPVPDTVRGEEVFAFVVLREGLATDAAQAARLQSYCLSKLAYFKAPGHIAFVPQLPQTASQKLARGTIKALALECLNAGRSIDLTHAKKRVRV